MCYFRGKCKHRDTMSAQLIDGKIVSNDLRTEIKQIITEFVASGQRPPGLAVIHIGKNPASTVYVATKRKACVELGFRSFAFDLPEDITQQALLTLIDELNHDTDVDGILVQLPLPQHIDSGAVIEKIFPSKDVDGFHPYNLGLLAQKRPSLRPCTPFGVMQLLEYYKIPVKGQYAVVVGASNIVGRPMALELLMAQATVTICHQLTKNLKSHIVMADLIIVATGSYGVIQPSWLHNGQCLIDVGFHRNEQGIIKGDVDFDSARQRVSWITPVPGGVGPMTVTTLLQNTLKAANLMASAELNARFKLLPL